MKTSLVTALSAFVAAAAVALGACSSDNSSSLVTAEAGTQQDISCTSSADCDTNLVCAYSLTASDAGLTATTGPSSCGLTKGICVGVGSLSVVQACSCSSPPTLVTVQQFGGVYTTSPATLCAADEDGGPTAVAAGDGG